LKNKYVKVMFGNKSSANGFEYKENEISVAEKWDPSQIEPSEMGGFNFSVENKILRYLVRGDTLCDVELPEDAEVVDCPNESCPHGIFRANKIIVRNLRPMTDELAMNFYRKADLPEKSFYKSLAGCCLRGYETTSMAILREKVNEKNINLVISEVDDYLKPSTYWDKRGNEELTNKIYSYLKEIQDSRLITIHLDRLPYIKQITNDKVINLTGQSGSGKSYYAKEHFSSDDYLIIDTDDIFSEHRFLKATGMNKELGEMFRKKYEILPSLFDDFDLIYKEILKYCDNIGKTIVIDSAQFHCIKDVDLLKGKIIIIRTSIDTCYNRCIERYKNNNPNATKDELTKYSEKKKPIYKWYKYTNEFILKIDDKK